MDETPIAGQWPADHGNHERSPDPDLPHYGPLNQENVPTQPRFETAGAVPTVPMRMTDGTIGETPVVPGQLVAAQRGGADGGHANTNGRRGMTRRGVLIGAGLGALGLGAAGAGIGYWLTRQGAAGLPNLSDSGRYLHLLRRAGFGARPGEIGEYLALGINGAVERLLNPASVSDDLDARLRALGLNFTLPQDVQRWFLLRMIYSRRPLEEKMTLFWHGLLTSSFRKVGGKAGIPLLVQQNQLLRANCLGTFDTLIRAITTDPAMLWWLDGRVNIAGKPNENYARELMELFVLGLTDATGTANYTQDDVEAGARALTGWVIPRGGGQSRFVARLHDTGSKTYLGQTGNLGLDDVVRIVCAHPAAGYHLANRLWTYFVYENPSASDLQPLIDAYYQQHHSITAVMRALLNSPQFFSDKAHRARIKSPTEFVVGAIRALEVVTDGHNLAPLMAVMGQSLFDPPNVAGWDGDKVSASWISTQAWMTRLNFINTLLAAASGGGQPGAKAGQGRVGGAVPVTASTSSLQELINTWKFTSARALVDFFVALLLDDQLPADRRATIDNFMSANTTAEGPVLTLSGGATLPAVTVRGALYLLMTLPEYHLN